MYNFFSPSLCARFFAATTITFGFVGPTDTGGIKIKAYAVQYKEMSQTWEEARNKSWPMGEYTRFCVLYTSVCVCVWADQFSPKNRCFAVNARVSFSPEIKKEKKSDLVFAR